jgi:hypothetical protein
MLNVFYLVKELLSDHLRRIRDSMLPAPLTGEGDEVHLRETMGWLKRAVENGKGGVSSHFSLVRGRWLAPFPETTGYIIPTFFDYYRFGADRYYYDTALRLADWLIAVQLENGACMQGTVNPGGKTNPPIVFNTGQNIFGFLRAFSEAGEGRYLEAAERAGHFLVQQVDGQGVWHRHLHHDLPHTYNSRTAWALLELYRVTGEKRYQEVAFANLDWTVRQQRKNGWFAYANFKPGELPNTHGLGYTVRGLLESYLLTGREEYRQAAWLTASKLFRLYEIRHRLYTFWDEKWKNHGKYFHRLRGRYACLTGNIQVSIAWMKLYGITGDYRFLNAAFKMLDFMKSLQHIRSRYPGIRGGVKGAFPINGSYSFLKYPNWAAKFLADALMLKMELERELNDRGFWEGK